MIAWDRVADVRAEMDGPDFDDIVEMFLEEMEGALRALPPVADATLPDALHFIKGCAANLGFQSLQQMCHRAERVLLDPAADDPPWDAAAIRQCYGQSRAAFLDGLAPAEVS